MTQVDEVAEESGQVWVEGYTTSRGVHVEGHYRRHSRRGGEDAGEGLAAASGRGDGAAPVVAGKDRRPTSLQSGLTPALSQDGSGALSESGAGPARCTRCGEFMGSGHRCVVGTSGLPEASYAGMTGDERVQRMLVDLDKSVQAIVESGQLQSWLDAMSSNGLNRWSANNRLLAVMQLNQRGDSLEDVHLMGFRQWAQFDRTVNKGAKAVWILAPVTRRFTRVDDDGEEKEERRVVGFKGVPVFNVSDTHGKPLPEPPITVLDGQASPGTLEGLQDRVGRAGYSYSEVEIPDCQPGSGKGTLGFAEPSTKRIVVDSRLSPAMKVSTLAHELGHVHCGHVDAAPGEYRRHRGRMETEAEMAAYLVNRSRGMSGGQVDAFSPGYIAVWSKGDAALMRASMDTAVKAYNAIMDGVWPK
mgnify:CR=1 FL=1